MTEGQGATAGESTPPLLAVENLHTTFKTDEGTLHAVAGVDFRIRRGETLGLVGESGCGKSITAYSILRLTPPNARTTGRILLYPPNGAGEPRDLAALDPAGREIRAVRGSEIGMVFQEPMSSFSPVHTIGNQMTEAILLHKTRNRREAREIAVDMLARVGIANPTRRIDEYPHQLSGGMRQRVMIALALSCDPTLLIADEPTTALDVTIQAQVLDLMEELQAQLGMAMLYITHDLGVIAELAEAVAVMYLGKIVEQTDADRLFDAPLHPYTVGLLKSMPTLGRRSRAPLAAIEGTVPVPIDLPTGCAFFGRCPRAMPGLCDRHDPPLVPVEPGHAVRCFLYPEVRDVLGLDAVAAIPAAATNGATDAHARHAQGGAQ